MLFESELRARSPLETLEERLAEGSRPLNEYAGRLVRGVVEHQARIDDLLSRYAHGWAVGRMPTVDRNALRIGVFEILYVDQVPDAVAVSEALALVQELSTEESTSFVNGVLGSILRDKAALSA